MKSPMVTNLNMTSSYLHTDLAVQKSPAGYYLGTQIWDDEFRCWLPGSRDSGYFKTEDEAAKYLKMVEAAANPQEYLRAHP